MKSFYIGLAWILFAVCGIVRAQDSHRDVPAVDASPHLDVDLSVNADATAQPQADHGENKPKRRELESAWGTALPKSHSTASWSNHAANAEIVAPTVSKHTQLGSKIHDENSSGEQKHKPIDFDAANIKATAPTASQTVDGGLFTFDKTQSPLEVSTLGFKKISSHSAQKKMKQQNPSLSKTTGTRSRSALFNSQNSNQSNSDRIR